MVQLDGYSERLVGEPEITETAKRHRLRQLVVVKVVLKSLRPFGGIRLEGLSIFITPNF